MTIMNIKEDEMKSDNIPPHPSSVEDKFPNTHQIVEMLKVMEERSHNTNLALIFTGEGYRTKPWKTSSVRVQAIIDYVYEKEDLKL